MDTRFAETSLSTLASTAIDQRFAMAAVLGSAVIFLALLPFARVQLAPFPPFIPIYESAMIVLDFATASLLLAEAKAIRSRAMLTLACGYVFTALVAAAHMLSFSGLFSPAGPLGADPQRTAWLYVVWHVAFPFYVIGYALLKQPEGGEGPGTWSAAAWSVLAALVLSTLAVALPTVAKEVLPPIMAGNRYTTEMAMVVASVWLSSFAAIGVLWWRRPHSVLDLWLMVVMWAWVFQIALGTMLNAGRYDVGFYAGRIYGLAATGMVLVTLLMQGAKLSQALRERTVALRRARDEALRAEHAKGIFLATMSHEIRTPMNGVMGLLEILELTRLDGEQRKMVEVVSQSGRSLLRIIDDILDFSKIEAGKLRLCSEATSIAEVVARVRQVYSGNARNKGLLLESSVDDALAQRVMVDGLRLQQVLNNLVHNAIKFTAAGRVTLRAEKIGCREGMEVVRFAVEDTGIGIAHEDLDRLFQPFVQAGARPNGGTGLGLSICRLLAKLMGGELRMESELGRGTRVLFTVPLAIAPAPVLSSPAQERRAAPSPAPASSVKAADGKSALVLLVDDHPVNRMVLAKQLAHLGYATVAAANGMEALDRIDEGGVGVVVTDCHMPGMDGYELARQVRAREADERRGRLPIIACTASASSSEAACCFAAGMSDFLAKPVQLEELRNKLHRWLPIGTIQATA